MSGLCAAFYGSRPVTLVPFFRILSTVITFSEFFDQTIFFPGAALSCPYIQYISHKSPPGIFLFL
jgi:hypothetical protein